MNKFVYFMAVGLAFTFLQVTTVSADTAAGLVTGGANAPADCGGVPCPTGDDAHTGDGEDCAAMSTPALVAACWDRKSTHADGAHAGMAPGTSGMAPALTIDDPLCVLAPAMRDPGCPNAMPGTAARMAPPAGNGMNPMPGAAPMAPPSGNVVNPAGGGVALTIDDPRCIVAPEARHHRCPGFVAP